MRNALHDRLEYLIAYSSQLIFVSGDTISQQQRTFEHFVFHQPDDTDIAMLTASSEMTLADYKRQICRQLQNTVVGSYIRPLSELLSASTSSSGSVLIAIVQAQHIPKELLQELWDSVQQSRSSQPSQHLNVLLFSESAWAQEAKKWLPSVNKDKPLLISSQSIEASSVLDNSTLVVVAKRREQFQEYLQFYAKRRSTQLSWRSISLITVTLLITAWYGWKLANTDKQASVIEAPVVGSGLRDLYPVNTEVEQKITDSVEVSLPLPDILVKDLPQPSIKELYGLTLLESPENDHYYIQLGSMQNEDALQAFISEKNLFDLASIYVTERNGRRFHVLLYSTAFTSRQEAQQALQTVQEKTKIEGVFLKPASTIANELILLSEP